MARRLSVAHDILLCSLLNLEWSIHSNFYGEKVHMCFKTTPLYIGLGCMGNPWSRIAILYHCHDEKNRSYLPQHMPELLMAINCNLHDISVGILHSLGLWQAYVEIEKDTKKIQAPDFKISMLLRGKYGCCRTGRN
jgi:hypothetical protein